MTAFKALFRRSEESAVVRPVIFRGVGGGRSKPAPLRRERQMRSTAGRNTAPGNRSLPTRYTGAWGTLQKRKSRSLAFLAGLSHQPGPGARDDGVKALVRRSEESAVVRRCDFTGGRRRAQLASAPTKRTANAKHCRQEHCSWEPVAAHALHRRMGHPSKAKTTKER